MLNQLVHCVYTSCETHAMSRVEMDAVVIRCRADHKELGITGILLYVDGCFMQVLEGKRHLVLALYERLLVDARDTCITHIILEAVPHRFFGEWTMGFAKIGSMQSAQILGCGDAHTREDLLASIGEGRAKKLLRAFSNGSWRTHLSATPRRVAA